MTQELLTNSETSDEEVQTAKNNKNTKPSDPEYFKKYYHRHYGCNAYTCPICGKTLSNNQKIKRHENSKFCLKAKNVL